MFCLGDGKMQNGKEICKVDLRQLLVEENFVQLFTGISWTFDFEQCITFSNKLSIVQRMNLIIELFNHYSNTLPHVWV